MKKIIKLFMLSFFIVINYSFYTKKVYAEQDFYSRNIQDLSYINNEILVFISDYNKNYQSNFKFVSPDIRTVLPKCETPLRLQWIKSIFVPEAYKLKDNNYYIRITCNKSVLDKKWNTYILTTRSEKDPK